LDLTGGVFSTIQVILEEFVDVNYVKFILGLIAIGFDIVFIIQHYVLYKEKRIHSLEKE
jgi:cystinosin